MISSFRARMFCVTTLIVVLVLVCVGLLAWSGTRDYETGIFDERLCGEARRVAMNPPPAFRMENFQSDTLGKLRLTSLDQMLFWFNTADGEQHFKSAHWPDEIDIDQLEWKTGGRRARPPPPAPPPPATRPAFRPGPGPAAPPEVSSRQDQPPPRDDDPTDPGPPRDGRPPPPEARRPAAPVECQFTSFKLNGADWHASMVATPRSRGFVAGNLAAASAELFGALQRAAAIALPLGLLLIAVGAWFLSGLALRPVMRLRDAMRGVDRNVLDQRLPDEGEDREFAELVSSYNNMLERLEASFNQASRFSADAAHELKTPLTILQGQLERAIRLTDNRSIQVNLSEMLDEVGRLASISRKLLLLSQADSGRLALMRKRVDFSRMLEDSLADALMLGLAVKIADEIDDGLTIQGDEQLLGQLLNNICGNAIKYTPEGGRIAVRARALANGVEALFSNTAPQVTREHRLRFFDRFYRGDAAHNRKVDGHGLGLSLSRVIARAHGGDLTLEPGADGMVVLRLFLPRDSGKA
jgi:two-component system, OmpR family, heavy metal sensor histidine kinase CusS